MKRYLAIITTGLALLSAAVLAQEFPVRPVRLIVPYPAASTSDFISRTLAQRLQEIWRQPVITENKPGASAMIGSEFVAKAAPDGHVLLLGGAQTHAMNVATVKNMLYDPLRDFTPIVQTTRANWMLAVHPSVPARTPKELIALIRSQPGKFTYGSSGIGGVSHLAFELLASELGLKLVHSPYKGMNQAALDAVSGRIQMLMGDQVTLMPFVKSGRLTAIAMTGNVRAPALPDVPTIDETLVPGFDAQSWQGIWGPRGMTSELVGKINADFVRVLLTPEVAERLRVAGFEPVGSTTEQFNAFVRREIGLWTAAARKAGIEPE
ncbi:MAG: tripartite tricarboxylate transporter substrate binding protein [Betaproteobacteria bacterium]|nr:tripartite tricarboxylate transporter substrate binding protein [Betaproteobacteria bacterium]